MKANEYVALFRQWQKSPPKLSEVFRGVPPAEDRACDSSDMVIGLCQKLVAEAPGIMKARQCQTNEAFGAVVGELRERWVAIGSRLGDPRFSRESFMKIADAMTEPATVTTRAQRKA